jgi:flagellar motor switch/type III secretory pathway protein FliN
MDSRVSLPDVCLVATGSQERLAELLGRPVVTEVVEPRPLTPAMHAAILRGARVCRVGGEERDAFVVLRRADEVRLLSFVFSTNRFGVGPSPIESRVADRLTRAVASACEPVCGRVRSVLPSDAASAAAESCAYFEVRTTRPSRAAFGVALTRESSAGPQIKRRIGNLPNVSVPVRATLGRAEISLGDARWLAVGAVIPLGVGLDALGVLEVNGAEFARGRCGTASGVLALHVSATVTA